MKKNEILEQALFYLSTNGIKFTMSQLATSLQISKKTIYTMFDSKETLLLEVIDNSFKEIKKAEKDIIDSNLELEEKISQIQGEEELGQAKPENKQPENNGEER